MEKIIMKRSCYNCHQEILFFGNMIQREKCNPIYEWQTREFCSFSCLSISTTLEQKLEMCASCKTLVNDTVKLKFCLRFGSEFHQFCSYNCLDVFKSSNQFCKLCQEKIRSFMLISHEERFCSPFCVARYSGRGINQTNFVNENTCQVCDKKGIFHFELLKEVQSYFFCSRRCIMKYREREPLKYQCALCGCLLLVPSEVINFDGTRRIFCSTQCCNIFILTKSRDAECAVCKAQKYSFDLIKCRSGIEVTFFCSLICLQKVIESIEKPVVDTRQNEPSFPALKIRSVSDLNERYVDIAKELSSIPDTRAMPTDDVSLGRLLLSLACPTSDNAETQRQENKNLQGDPQLLEIVSRCKTTLSLNILERILSRRSKKTSDKAVGTETELSDDFDKQNQADATQGAIDAASQTDPDSIWNKVIPVPYPVYIPTPCYQFPQFQPVPLVIPVPIPIPIPIPTIIPTEESMEDSESCGESLSSEYGNYSEISVEESSICLQITDAFHLVDEVENDTIVERASRSPPSTASPTAPPSSASTSSPTAPPSKPCAEATERIAYKGSNDWQPRTARGENEPEYDNHLGTHARYNSPEKRKLLQDLPTESEAQSAGDNVDIQQSQSPCCESPEEFLVFESAENSPVSEGRDLERIGHDDVDLDSPLWQEHMAASSTLNHTAAMHLWNKFIAAKKSDESFMSSISNPHSKFRELNNSDKSSYLAAFFAELRALKSSDHPSFVIYILLCIQKVMTKKVKIDSIFMNIVYQKFGKLFFSFLEEHIMKYDNLHSFLESARRSPRIKITEQMLWESRQLGTCSPSVLVFSVFYFNTKIFKLQRVEDHENMSFRRFMKFSHLKLSKNGSVSKAYSLRYTFPKDKSSTSSDITRDMHEDRVNSWKCPVKLKEFYSSKCPREILLSGNFYYAPIHASSLDSKIWFSVRKLPTSTLRNMLNFVLMVDDIQRVLHKPRDGEVFPEYTL